MKINQKESSESEDEDIIDDFDDISCDDILDDMEDSALPLQKHQDLLKDLTDFAPYMKDSFNNWLGITWSEKEKAYIENPLLKPIMNKMGAAWCIGFLKTYTRANNIITNIGSDEYKHIMKDIIENVWLNLGTREELGVKNNGDLLRVCNEIEHAAALILMGAGDGKYNRLLSTTVNRNEQVSIRDTDSPIRPQSSDNDISHFYSKMKKKLIGGYR